MLSLSLTDWSWLLHIICSVALALRVDIVSEDPAPTADLYLLCLSLFPSVWGPSPEDAPSQSQQNARISFIKIL